MIRFAPLSQVRLTQGPFADRQRVHTRHLLAIEPDRLLAPFRLQAGLTLKAPRYGGWESRDISGHSLGHYLSAIAMLHAATGEPGCLERVNHIVDELALCQRANGNGYVLPVDQNAFDRLGNGDIDATPFSLNGVWVPFYTLHKLLAGLRDAFRHCGNKNALGIALRVATWLESVLAGLSPVQIQAMLATEHGGMNEVLADLTADSGDPRFLALAARCFHHRKVLDPMFRGEDRLNGLHGNTQIPKVVGLAREFELTGNPLYQNAALTFWDHVLNHRSYVIGGHGESEHFFPVEQFPQRLTPNTCETCNTYNLLKLTRHLFTWQADAARMDFVERAMINHLAANIGRAPGEFGYFLGLSSVGVKVFSTAYDSWWCCVGTGLENPARYGEMIYAVSSDTLWVNLFLGSTFDWREKGVFITQDTVFPDEETTRLRIRTTTPARFILKLRHPHWCAIPELTLNGRTLAFLTASSYISIEREWTNDDVLELRLPMTPRLEALPHSDGRIQALVFGPTVLAAIVPDEPGIANPSKLRFSEHLEARGKTDAFPPFFVSENHEAIFAGLKPTDHFAEFRADGIMKPADLTFVPMHRVYEEAYAVYLQCLSPDEWIEKENSLRAERDELLRVENGKLDAITPGYQQPEVEHALAGENTTIEDFADRKCRIASDGGWFSYQMKTDPEEAMVLQITYWGGVWHERNFDVLIDGEHLARQKLLTNRPGDFFDQYHEIPKAFTAGKQRVTLRFQSHPGDIAGGVFGLRMLRASAVPENRYEQRIVFKNH